MTDKYQLVSSMTFDETVMSDYEYNEDIFNDEDERVAKIKYIITNNLTDTEKLIYIIYIECNLNVNLLAREMNVKAPALRYYIKKITKKIRHLYDN